MKLSSGIPVQFRNGRPFMVYCLSNRDTENNMRPLWQTKKSLLNKNYINIHIPWVKDRLYLFYVCQSLQDLVFFSAVYCVIDFMSSFSFINDLFTANFVKEKCLFFLHSYVHFELSVFLVARTESQFFFFFLSMPVFFNQVEVIQAILS